MSINEIHGFVVSIANAAVTVTGYPIMYPIVMFLLFCVLIRLVVEIIYWIPVFIILIIMVLVKLGEFIHYIIKSIKSIFN